MQEYPLNPKALSLGELYGEFNLSTNEWADGVLSSIMRHTCAGPRRFHRELESPHSRSRQPLQQQISSYDIMKFDQ